ncbi:kinase-like domain-containing protein, partial [Mucidula mucida]
MILTLIRRTRLWIYHLLSVESGWGHHHVRIFRFGLPFVLKLSDRTESTEADALHYLNSQFRGSNRLPIPQVYDSFSLGSCTYTLMSKLPGEMLMKVAGEQTSPFTEEFFCGICSEIEAVMRRVWSLPQPPHLKGQVMISASGDGLLVMYEDFLQRPFPSRLSYYAEATRFYDEETMLQTMSKKFGDVKTIFEADRLVFTHSDLTLPNILVTKDMRLAGIIDWEDAGWCPMEHQWRRLR